MGAVFAYSLDDNKAYQLTDGLSDARFAVFDKSGKYLYFAASTDVGLSLWFADMSAMNRPVTRSVYVMVLRKDLPSPLAPESDEEKPKDEQAAAETDTKAGSNADTKPDAKADDKADAKDKSAKDKPVVVRIDRERIDQRVSPSRSRRATIRGLRRARRAFCF
jgi:tricorn protease